MKKPLDRGGAALAAAVENAYDRGLTDYGMEPLVRVDASGEPVGRIKDGDAVIFCCRRGEREIELTDAFTDPAFDRFERAYMPGLDFVILTMYHEKFAHLPIAFAPASVTDTLGETLARAGKTQLHCAESEKFAHVTFFFNGGNSNAFAGEDDIRIPSPKGVPFEQQPELSLPAVAGAVIDGLKHGYDFIVTNFANGDVIGHTSSEKAKLACAESVDYHLDRVINQAKALGYAVAVTADHGNLEVMVTDSGKPHVAHTTNPVPFVFIDPQDTPAGPPADGRLCDVAPTVLKVMGVPQPEGMTGTPLIDSAAFGPGRKMLLIILDGWGFGAKDGTNPIHAACTSHWDALLDAYPNSRLCASGTCVGLQDGKAGNSEAGHINLGSGRVVLQDDVRLDAAMQDGSFAQNEVFLDTLRRLRARGGALHLLALLTYKSSHGSLHYPLELLRMARDIPETYVHILFDGRSTEPGSAPRLLTEFEAMMDEIGAGQIVDGIGRGIALDRDGNYAKIQKAYGMLVSGKGERYA